MAHTLVWALTLRSRLVSDLCLSLCRGRSRLRRLYEIFNVEKFNLKIKIFIIEISDRPGLDLAGMTSARFRAVGLPEKHPSWGVGPGAHAGVGVVIAIQARFGGAARTRSGGVPA